MFFSTHSIVGAAVGIATKNPAIGFAAGILTHHAMDAIPHYDQGSLYTLKSNIAYLGIKRGEAPHFSFSKRDWIILLGDFAIGGIAILLLLLNFPQEFWIPLLAGVLGCLLPDIIDSSPLWSEKLRSKSRVVMYYHGFHSFFHWTAARDQAVLGLTTQIALITISLWYLLTYVLNL